MNDEKASASARAMAADPHLGPHLRQAAIANDI